MAHVPGANLVAASMAVVQFMNGFMLPCSPCSRILLYLARAEPSNNL